MNINNFFNFKEDEFIGYITELTFNTAKILSHDYQISRSNFIPKNSFLIVNVENEGKVLYYFLLRVIGISYLDNNTKNNKEITIQKVTDFDVKMDDFQNKINDPINKNKLSFYQLDCNIIGTFYSHENNIKFGSDSYSFNVSTIYKTFKPKEKNLELIVNFVKEDRLKATNELLSQLSESQNNPTNNIKQANFPIGTVRYASTILENEIKSEVLISPSDFIKQKTGIFGMTRTGKSNTVKILVKSIMELSKINNIKMGQIIYDINGEYSNDNSQNNKLTDKNLYTVDNENIDKNFNYSLNNFYIHPNYGLKVIQNGLKSGKEPSNYINSFLSIKNIEKSSLLYLFWIILLYVSDYNFPRNIKLHNDNEIVISEFIAIKLKNISKFKIINNDFFKKIFKFNDDNFEANKSKFNQEFLTNIKNNYLILTERNISQLIQTLNSYYKDTKASLIKDIQNIENENDISSLISLITKEDSGRPISGWQIILPYRYTHCENSIKDYREDIYNKLKNGETVIIDFSIGDPNTRLYIADELMQYIFDNQIELFRKIKNSPIINIVIEEAHNVLGSNATINSLWPRIAKEGAKYNIGLIYITQEPSAIHDSILANTANFVIAHLNNEKEINTISQYEDLGDFRDSIKKSEDVGFVRMRMLSKPYTIPIQINKFIN